MKNLISIFLLLLASSLLAQDIDEIEVVIYQEGSILDTQSFSSFSAATSIDETIIVITSVLTPGMFLFTIIVKSDDVIVSIFQTGSFLQEEEITENAEIFELEYYVNSDGGVGAGSSVSITS